MSDHNAQPSKLSEPVERVKTAADLIRNLSPEKQALLAQRLKEKRQQAPRQFRSEQGRLSGPLPPIPIIMLNYPDHDPLPWWRAFQAQTEIPRVLGVAQLKEAVQCLVAHHDNLRLRLTKGAGNDYCLFIAETEENAFLERDLSALPVAKQDAVIHAEIEKQWASLNFSTGPSFRVVFFELGLQRLPHLLIVLHHFAADGYSIGILLNDFQTVCRQLISGEPIRLPPKTTSTKEWAERMHAYVHSDLAASDAAYWMSLPWSEIRPTPVDYPDASHSLSARLVRSLTVEETQVLLEKVPAAYNVPLFDVLLAACALAFAGHSHLKLFSVLILHHGRSLKFDGIDLFRTVGNFYAPYSLFFDNAELDLDVGDPAKVLQTVSRKRAAVPHGGATWLWISYYSTEKFISWAENMEIVNNLVFNHLGQVKLDAPGSAALFRNVQPIQQTSERSQDPNLYDLKLKVPYYSCTTVIEGGQLKVCWEYFEALSRRATVDGLVDSYLAILRSLIKAVG